MLYIIGAICIFLLVLGENYWRMRKLGPFDDRKGAVVDGFANALVYGAIWPSVVLFVGVGGIITLIRKMGTVDNTG